MEIINQSDLEHSIYFIQLYDGKTTLSSQPRTNVDEILNMTIDEISKIEFDISFPQPKEVFVKQKRILIKDLDFNNNFKFIKSIQFTNFGQGEFFEIQFLISPSLNNWRYQFSFDDYYHTLIKILEEGSELISVSRKGLGSFLVGFSIESTQQVFYSISDYSRKLNIIHSKITAFLNRVEKDSISNIFDFPEKLKVPCEQYLLYFAQFLQDLGINATSNLKEEAGKVLFSVTPTDDVEALDKIREALAVYLNLPASPIVYDESFAAMRLQQQIENLQHSQKMAVREIRSAEREMRLAQTVIEHQDKIIVQKDSLIEQQNKVIEKIQSKSIMIDSLENKAEFEKVFDGLEFGESKELKEKLGIKFNPVTSLKSLGKKLVGKDDEIITLDLDKDT